MQHLSEERIESRRKIREERMVEAKQLLKNVLITFWILFSMLALFGISEDLEFYRDEFRIKDLLWTVSQALYWSTLQMGIAVPSLCIFRRFGMKNSYKILITLGITAVFSYVYLMTHMQFTF